MPRKLRIFQLLNSSANEAVPGGLIWHRNLYEPLVDLGHDVTLYSAREGSRARNRKSNKLSAKFADDVYEAFLRCHREHSVDLFFSYLIDGMIDPGVIDRIRELGVPTCNFSCNNAHQFDLVTHISPHFDFNLHSERDAAPKFKAIGAKPLWWQMAANPRYYRPHQVERTFPVSFAGANYATRANYVHHLLANGVEVHAFGPGWTSGTTHEWRSLAKRWKLLGQMALSTNVKDAARTAGMLAHHEFRRSLVRQYPSFLHSAISDDDMVKLYSSSEISLGFLEVYENHDPSATVVRHLHLREFEGPMSGALYCTGYSDELAEFFEPDKEVITYRNEAELLDKVRFYLAHSEDADRIRRRGIERATGEHTYQRRYQVLFSELGLV